MLPDLSSSMREQLIACARLARVSYNSITSIAGDVVPIRAGSDVAFVLRDRERSTAAIVCRGSDEDGSGRPDLKDWVGNIQGDWQQAAGYMMTQIDTALELMLDRREQIKLWVIGHSRGGAIAQKLATAWPKCATRCVTFGTPRSAKKTDPILQDAWSVCLKSDPVPRLPLYRKGFRDPAMRLWLDPEDGSFDDEWPFSWLSPQKSETWVTAANVLHVGFIYARMAHTLLSARWREAWNKSREDVRAWATARHGMGAYLRALELSPCG